MVLFCPSDSSIAAQLSQPWQYNLVLENHGDSSRLHSWRLAYVILTKNNHLLAECHTLSRYVQSLKSFSYLYRKWVDQLQYVQNTSLANTAVRDITLTYTATDLKSCHILNIWRVEVRSVFGKPSIMVS